MHKGAFQHLTTNELRPAGWLKWQLQVQAEGLSGHLDLVWPDIKESKWIGGDKEGWERVPYWLDGFIPLAYLLDDEELKKRNLKVYEQTGTYSGMLRLLRKTCFLGYRWIMAISKKRNNTTEP